MIDPSSKCIKCLLIQVPQYRTCSLVNKSCPDFFDQRSVFTQKSQGQVVNGVTRDSMWGILTQLSTALELPEHRKVKSEWVYPCRLPSAGAFPVAGVVSSANAGFVSDFFTTASRQPLSVHFFVFCLFLSGMTVGREFTTPQCFQPLLLFLCTWVTSRFSSHISDYIFAHQR